MSNDSSTSAVAAPAAKVLSAWTIFGLTSWAEVASMLAAVYTLILILEWLFNKFIRPVCEDRGWLKRRKRRKSDCDE